MMNLKMPLFKDFLLDAEGKYSARKISRDKNTDKKERRERIKNEERDRSAECAMRRERQ
jgi:hypothetical protein